MSSSASPRTALAAWAARLLRVHWIVRVPVGLYRARLGCLLGSRLLMLEHTGRNTGARSHVVLEVVDHPRPGTYVVVSGFGDRAQWFRNVRADPRVRVFAGSRRSASAGAGERTAAEHWEAATALTSYAARHPRAWASLRPVLEATLGAEVDTTGTSLPVVAFDLTAR